MSNISHTAANIDLEAECQAIEAKIRSRGDLPYATVELQLNLLSELAACDIGRFLILHKGIDGYWTHQILTHPWSGRATSANGKPLSKIEDFIFNKAPVVLATQERCKIFLKQNQRFVRDNAVLACIPSGLMGELFYLNFDNVKNVRFVGVDIDPISIDLAKKLAHEMQLFDACEWHTQDAWALEIYQQYDVISSNGLSIYESNDDRITDLYRIFHQALKPGGCLVTSALTMPPTITDHCEWNMSKINQEDLLMQKLVLVDIVGVKWQCYQSTEQVSAQLRKAGFSALEFIYDTAKIFPTIIATR